VGVFGTIGMCAVWWRDERARNVVERTHGEQTAQTPRATTPKETSPCATATVKLARARAGTARVLGTHRKQHARVYPFSFVWWADARPLLRPRFTTTT
jgi:hypothetical protein